MTQIAWIEKIRDLSSIFGGNFIEFETASLSDFNPTIARVSQGVNREMAERAHKEVIKSHILDTTSQEYRMKHFQIIRPMSNNLNFFSITDEKVQVLKKLVNRCLNEYLRIYKKEYRLNRPNRIHSWTLAYREIFASAFHIHHYNSMNIAGIYYAAGDFSMGNGDLTIVPDSKNPNLSISYVPAVGKLILFPANRPHATGSYLGTNIRVSIAFDIWFKGIENRKFIPLK